MTINRRGRRGRRENKYDENISLRSWRPQRLTKVIIQRNQMLKHPENEKILF